MTWTDKQIQQHKKAAELLNRIKNEVFALLKIEKSISEYEVTEFILKRFGHYNLAIDQRKGKEIEVPIVAFRENTSFVHYYPKKDNSKKLEPESLILLDIWARLNEKDAPYADITWMAYKGNNLPNNVLEAFNLVISARDSCLDFIELELEKNKLPSGIEVDSSAREIIAKKGWKELFKHTTGHSLGLEYVHGKEPGLNLKNDKPVERNIGYTIEPGIYFDKNFGVRSEIDFYINSDNELVVTTNSQKDIVKI